MGEPRAAANARLPSLSWSLWMAGCFGPTRLASGAETLFYASDAMRSTADPGGSNGWRRSATGGETLCYEAVRPEAETQPGSATELRAFHPGGETLLYEAPQAELCDPGGWPLGDHSALPGGTLLYEACGSQMAPMPAMPAMG